MDEPLRQLGAELAETPMGSWTAVDAFGRTSVPGVWAVGNSGIPNALVPIAMGSGATAALAVNGEFVAEEVAAVAARVRGTSDPSTRSGTDELAGTANGTGD
jgi:pyruvate/2-oxoglutarate dehydrogenase complex dihydrolipoamide dehydrogenase (E3) component